MALLGHGRGPGRVSWLASHRGCSLGGRLDLDSLSWAFVIQLGFRFAY